MSSLTLISIHDYWKSHSFDCMDLCCKVMSLLFNTLFTLIYLTNSIPSFSSELKSHLFREASHDSCSSSFLAPGSSLPLHFSPDACLVLVFPFWNIHFLTPGTCLSDSQNNVSSGSLQYRHTPCTVSKWMSAELTARRLCPSSLLPLGSSLQPLIPSRVLASCWCRLWSLSLWRESV